MTAEDWERGTSGQMGQILVPADSDGTTSFPSASGPSASGRRCRGTGQQGPAPRA